MMSNSVWVVFFGILIAMSLSSAEEIDSEGSYNDISLEDYFLWYEGIRFKIDDDISFGFGGRVVYDIFSLDVDNDVLEGDLDNVNRYRAVRFNMTGTFKKIFRFKAEIDFADTEGFDFEFKSTYIVFRDPIYQFAQVQMGFIREPFGLEGLTSARFTTFMERALNTFTPTRNLGVLCSFDYEKRFLFSIGLYSDQSGDNPPTFDRNSETLTTRLSGLVYQGSDEEYAHLAVAYSYRKPRDGSIDFDARPDAKFGFDFIDTDTIEDVDSVQLCAFESALILKNFSIQAEFMSAYLDRDFEESLFFWGAYVYCSYFLTGESRRYKPLSGKFGEIFPDNPVGSSWDSFGAVEVALRFSRTSLDSGEFDQTMDNMTLGVNWYLTTFSRITVNYIFSYVNLEDPNHILGVRFQVYW